MRIIFTMILAVVLLSSFAVFGQVNPADRSDDNEGWDQGVILNFEEEAPDTLIVNSFDCDGIPIFQKAENPDPVAKPDDFPFNSTNVGMVTTTACTWEGLYIDKEFYLDFTNHPVIWVDVYAPAPDKKVLVKLEVFSNNQDFMEVEATTTVGNAWERLEFDFSGAEPGKYGRVVLFMDFGSDVAGDVWYFDNVRQIKPIVTYDDGLISDFETVDGLFWGYWSGAEFSTVDNPDTEGNPSAMVGQFFTSTELWEGAANAERLAPLDFTEGGEFSVLAYGPVDRTLMMKIENTYDKTINTVEVQMTLTKDYEWEELLFDFTDAVAAMPESVQTNFYDRVGIFPDFWSDTEGDDWYIDDLKWLGKPTAVNESKPQDYQLAVKNYPNPFNPATKIDFSLPVHSNVELVVYNVLGKKVATLLNEAKSAGAHSVQFNGNDLPSGSYFYTLTTDAGSITKKMLLMK